MSRPTPDQKRAGSPILDARDDDPQLPQDQLEPEHLPPADLHISTKRRLNDAFNTSNYNGVPVEAHVGFMPFDYSSHEAMPALPSTHPQFFRAQKKAVDLVDLTIGAMEEFKDIEKSETLEELLQEMQENKDVDYGTVAVGVVGDAGAGKSSFINVLLGYPSLAKAGDSGSSCTQVVTEYVDAANATNPFKAEILFKSREVIMEEVDKHFKAYMDWVTCSREPQKIDVDDDEDELAVAVQDDFNVAEEYLLQAFGLLPGFSNKKALLSTLKKLPAAARAEKVTVLKRQAAAVLDQYNVQDEVPLLIVADNLSVLQRHLKPFSEKAASGKQALWPLVAFIRVTLQSPLLRQGLVLADCPGVSDSNASRRLIARDYLRECDVVLVVGNIDRVLNQGSIKKYLNTYIIQNGIEKTILIATKVDHIEHDPDDLTAEDSVMLEHLQDRLREAGALLDEDDDSAQNIKAERQAQADLTRCRALIRSRNVVEQGINCVRSNLRDSGHELTIIPTSSSAGKAYVLGRAARNPPCLKLNETGFKEVRHKLVEFGHENRLEVLRAKVDEFSTRFTRLHFLLDHAKIDGSDEILALLPAPRACSLVLARGIVANVRNTFERVVPPGMAVLIEDQSSSWPMKFTAKLTQLKSDWPAPLTLRAFCNRMGAHKPSKADHLIDWNRELAEMLVTDVQKLVKNFVHQCDTYRDQTVRDVRGIFNALRDALESNEKVRKKYSAQAQDPLEVHWQNWMRSFAALFVDLKREMLKAVLVYSSDTVDSSAKGAKRGATLGAAKKRTAYNMALERIYTLVMEEYESGTKHITIRRWGYLMDHIPRIDSSSPLVELDRSLKRAFRDALREFNKDLSDVLVQPFDAIEKDLDCLLRENSGLSDEDRALAKAKLVEVTPRVARTKAQINRALAFVTRMKDGVVEPEPGEDEHGPGAVVMQSDSTANMVIGNAQQNIIVVD